MHQQTNPAAAPLTDRMALPVEPWVHTGAQAPEQIRTSQSDSALDCWRWIRHERCTEWRQRPSAGVGSSPVIISSEACLSAIGAAEHPRQRRGPHRAPERGESCWLESADASNQVLVSISSHKRDEQHPDITPRRTRLVAGGFRQPPPRRLNLDRLTPFTPESSDCPGRQGQPAVASRQRRSRLSGHSFRRQPNGPARSTDAADAVPALRHSEVFADSLDQPRHDLRETSARSLAQGPCPHRQSKAVGRHGGIPARGTGPSPAAMASPMGSSGLDPPRSASSRGRHLGLARPTQLITVAHRDSGGIGVG